MSKQKGKSKPIPEKEKEVEETFSDTVEPVASVVSPTPQFDPSLPESKQRHLR